MSKKNSTHAKAVLRKACRRRFQQRSATLIGANKRHTFKVPNAGIRAASEHPIVTEDEHQYIDSMPVDDRCRLLVQLHNCQAVTRAPPRLRILESNIPDKENILQRVCRSHGNPKFDDWLDVLLSIPFGKLMHPPAKSLTDLNGFLLNTRARMDMYLFGQDETKDELTRLLCQWARSGGLVPFAIGLEGPPGMGKTTFAKKVIAIAMQRPFVFIGLGGANDTAQLSGHSYTYEGALPGRIVEGLRTSNVMNPCYYFDEVDKLSRTDKGGDVENILIHLTDREQNSHFNDRYLEGIPLDVSNSIFVFSFNDRSFLNKAFLDRLNVLKFDVNSLDDKVQIAKKHLIPKLLLASAMTDLDIHVPDDSIAYIISSFTCSEPGVRKLEKVLDKLFSTVNVLKHSPDSLKVIRSKISDTSILNRGIIDTIMGQPQPDVWPCNGMYT